ncbi:MAG: hypothetical protein PHS41_02125 [Victivallaceae bacterium]|nr:hypothetical protein [Victivallaceae bacterium]
MKLALFFGNRGFFPGSLIASARKELVEAVRKAGFESLLLPEEATRFGAVETAAEGRIYAKFLEEHKGEFDGVILCLPNFGDENGASEGLRDAGVPIYVLAYPDELNRMDFAHRRDAFCGKFSIMDVFTQFKIPFTAWAPHTLHPSQELFQEHLRKFGAVCRIVKRLRRCRIGAVGARPTLFKTIRFDETALQGFGITTEVFDNSDLLVAVDAVGDRDKELLAKLERYTSYTDFSGVPADKLTILAKISVALDRMIAEHELDAVALRCWSDLQKTLKISPCVVLSELGDRCIPAACELDVGNAVAMLALTAASEGPATCLDWNNNYADDPDRCILFHCGPVPQRLMAKKGTVIDHPMFAKALGDGCGYGCNVGLIRPMNFTFASTTTKDGKLCYYSGEGKFTGEPLGEGYFGCGGVACIEDLQRKLGAIGYGGYRHHVSAAEGFWSESLDEAFRRYLNWTKTEL